MTKTITAMSMLFVAWVLAAPAVHAQDSASVRVPYLDLNLASDSGRDHLQLRITQAARIVCGVEDSRELALWFSAHDCRRDAVARAKPAYDAAVAGAVHGTVSVLDTAALVVTNH
jgi:UrcA family protein